MTFDICPNIANIEHLFFLMVYYVYGLANYFHNTHEFKNLHAMRPHHLMNVRHRNLVTMYSPAVYSK